MHKHNSNKGMRGTFEAACEPEDPATLLSIEMICQRTTAARSTIYSWVRKGVFPGPVRVGPRRVAWRKTDVDEWIASRPKTQR